jgi:hypothetical protein
VADTPFCEGCGETEDLVQVDRFDDSKPWYCRDTVACFARPWIGEPAYTGDRQVPGGQVTHG